MKALILALVCMTGITAKAGEFERLGRVYEYTFAEPYYCGAKANYETAAMFLTPFAEWLNAPDLIYDGCGSNPSSVSIIVPSRDKGIISDLGEIQLSKENPLPLGFDGTKYIIDQPHSQLAIKNHTYMVLESRDDTRAVYFFKIIELNQGGSMKIQYVVNSYAYKAGWHNMDSNEQRSIWFSVP